MTSLMNDVDAVGALFVAAAPLANCAVGGFDVGMVDTKSEP